MKNIGKVWIKNTSPENWKYKEKEAPPTKHEFEISMENLSGLLEGFILTKRLPHDSIYDTGDFLYERTHLVCINEDKLKKPPKELVEILQKWLKNPRWNNWRIILQPNSKENDFLAIYCDEIVTSPKRRGNISDIFIQ